jgi:hypothetical protein
MARRTREARLPAPPEHDIPSSMGPRLDEHLRLVERFRRVADDTL